MASKYLADRKKALSTEREAAIRRVTLEFSSKKNSSNRRFTAISLSTVVGWGFGLGVVAGLISLTSDAKSFWPGMLASLVAAGVVWLMSALFTWEQKKIVERRLRRLDDELEAEKEKIFRQYDERYEGERAAWNEAVAKSRKKFFMSTANAPIAKNLSRAFEKKIRSADRRPHIQTIEADFTFRVEENGIVADNGHLDFELWRFKALPSLYDRVAFAQFLGKCIQLEISKAFRRDPLAPSRDVPAVRMEREDNEIRLIYSVANPNFKPAVSLSAY